MFRIEKRHIPKKLMIYEAGELLDDLNDDWDKMLGALNEFMDIAKSKTTVFAHYEDTEFDNRKLYEIVRTILEEEGLQLYSYSSGSEDGKMHNIGVYEDKLTDLILATTIAGIEVKGSEDDSPKDKE